MLRSPAAFLRQAQPIVVGAASSSTSGAAQATCSGAGASGRLLSSLARHSASPRSSQLIGASGHSSALSQLNSSPAWRRNASTDSERPFGSRISDDFDPRLVNYFRLAIYAGVASVLAAYLLDTRAAFHRLVTMPLVHRLVDPEDAHRWAVELGKMGAVPREKVAIDDETLEIELFGKLVTNPIGLAAGFDKNAECVDAMLNVGFGLVEIGSVTPRPQEGNPRPRLFRLHADEAAINRYGLNSQGVDEVRERLGMRVARFLQRLAEKSLDPIPQTPQELGLNMSMRTDRLLGINLSKNKTSPADSNDDYVEGVRKLGHLADYLVVNVSCPNQVGITSLQRKGVIEDVIKDVLVARDQLPNKPPVLVKIGPDNSDDELADIASAALACGVDGAIVSNTSNQRPASLKSTPSKFLETGGLSGPPIKPLALRTLRKFYTLTSGKIPLIGCGGIMTADDALQFARNGASAVQLYTGMTYRGPGIVYEIKKGIKEQLQSQGKRWKDIVGEAVRNDE